MSISGAGAGGAGGAGPSASPEADARFREGTSVIEAAPPRGRPAISIRGLRKTFGFVGAADGSSSPRPRGCLDPLRRRLQAPGVVAVDDLDLDVYDGQITALLGPNGAGKTTTISMLTGMIESNAGDININGLSLREGLGQIRRSMGVCPQFDILWPTLTVFEHLQIYAAFKGIPADRADRAIFRAIKEVDLLEKTDEQSSRLSGGQRRKLSLAIAFIGGPRVVILDEPTSGMDPYARRKMWEVISRFKAGRTILLTTHFMDEADLLSDRIAIMARGSLVCYGSSLFLKSKFGAGYHVGIDVGRAANNEGLRERLLEAVRARVPEAYLQSAAGSELSFLLPGESASSFSGLLSELQRMQEAAAIGSYGISCSTLDASARSVNAWMM